MKLKIAHAFMAGYLIGTGLMMIFQGIHLAVQDDKYQIIGDLFYARS